MATETSLGRYVEDTRNLLATRLRDSLHKSCKLMWYYKLIKKKTLRDSALKALQTHVQ